MMVDVQLVLYSTFLLVCCRLVSGGLGFRMPHTVLGQIISMDKKDPKRHDDVHKIAGSGAHWPRIFSYELCCAGMGTLLVPELSQYITGLHENEAFRNLPPEFYTQVLGRQRAALEANEMAQAKEISENASSESVPIKGISVTSTATATEAATGAEAAGATVATAANAATPNAKNVHDDCEDVSGVYLDSGVGKVTVFQSGCEIQAANDAQGWEVIGSVVGSVLHLWLLTGQNSKGKVTWSNGAVWARE
eukprot:TRINITY_DN13080_c0_g1_i1.p2 TRINITY_DN13080_c0_g1~~TRINITY_DN13080_c0_g1_i1.p2  ORF type:complete len:249 (-),score=58.07 TRINITY_DN13080_c0_g1_i1:36-782(-)